MKEKVNIGLDNLFKKDSEKLFKGMKEKIYENKDKGVWNDLSITFLYKLLKYQFYKLDHLMYNNEDNELIKDKCKNIANYVMMINSNLDSNIHENKN